MPDGLRGEVVLLDPVQADEQPRRDPRRPGAAEHRAGQRVHADGPDQHHHRREPAQHDVEVARPGGVAEPRPLGEERGPEEAGVDVRRGTPSPAIASTNPTITYEVVNRATGSTTDGRPVLHSTSTPVAVAQHRHARARRPQLGDARADRAGQRRPRRRAQDLRQAPAVEGVEVRGRRRDRQQREREQHEDRRVPPPAERDRRGRRRRGWAGSGHPGLGEPAAHDVADGGPRPPGRRDPGHHDGRRFRVPPRRFRRLRLLRRPGRRSTTATRPVPARACASPRSRPPAAAGAPERGRPARGGDVARRDTATGARTTGGTFPRVTGARRRHGCSSGRVRLHIGNGTSTATQHATWTSA